MAAPIIHEIVTQHAEDSAFLWILRDAAVRAPHYNLKDLARLDERVEAHLDGLRVAGDEGWKLAEEGLAHEEPGEAFAAAVLALESGERDRLDRVLAAVGAAPEMFRGLASACGWVAPKALQGTVSGLLNGGSPFLQRIGITACAAHRVDPGSALVKAVADDDPLLRARALRTTGELGRRDLLAALREQLSDSDLTCAFWAAWSAVLLGDRERALERLAAIAAARPPYDIPAAGLALRAIDAAESLAWMKGLFQDPASRRKVIVAAGVCGDPHYVPWLIKQMESPEVARVAGEAFSMITGVDLAYEDLEGEWPEGFEAGPTENPEDEDVGLDPDEDLPWPKPELIEGWWKENSSGFQAGRRYLVGKPIAPEHCQDVLRAGFQRQRIAAALELALMKPDAPLFETRAPGFRQVKQLA